MENIVGVHLISKNATIPFKATELSACYDICACLHTDTVKIHQRSEPLKVEKYGTDESFIRLFPDEMALIPTGIVFCLPKSHHLKFYSRSGNVWKRMLSVANQPAVIDSDYTQESYVLLHNSSDVVQRIKTGDAIAQCELCENITNHFVKINDDQFTMFLGMVKKTSSRNGGLGSTS